MDMARLTPEQKTQFYNEGYLIVRNALDEKIIGRLIEAGDRMIASTSEVNRQRGSAYYDGFRNCIAMDDAFLPLLTHPKTFPLIAELFGANIHLVTSHLIYKHSDPADTPITKRDPGWHRDIAGTPDDLGHAHIPRMEMKCAYYLTDLSQNNWGATMFSPRSNQLKEKLSIAPGKVDPENAIEPLLKPGDAVFFENRTWHAASVNLSGWTRKAVMFGYGYRWLAPMDYALQSPELVEKVDEIGKQMLGADRDPRKGFNYHKMELPLKDWCKKNGIAYATPK